MGYYVGCGQSDGFIQRGKRLSDAPIVIRVTDTDCGLPCSCVCTVLQSRRVVSVQNSTFVPIRGHSLRAKRQVGLNADSNGIQCVLLALALRGPGTRPCLRLVGCRWARCLRAHMNGGGYH